MDEITKKGDKCKSLPKPKKLKLKYLSLDENKVGDIKLKPVSINKAVNMTQNKK